MIIAFELLSILLIKLITSSAVLICGTLFIIILPGNCLATDLATSAAVSPIESDTAYIVNIYSSPMLSFISYLVSCKHLKFIF